MHRDLLPAANINKSSDKGEPASSTATLAYTRPTNPQQTTQVRFVRRLFYFPPRRGSRTGKAAACSSSPGSLRICSTDQLRRTTSQTPIPASLHIRRLAGLLKNVHAGQVDARKGVARHRQPWHVETPPTRRDHAAAECDDLLREEYTADSLQRCCPAGPVVGSNDSTAQGGPSSVRRILLGQLLEGYFADHNAQFVQLRPLVSELGMVYLPAGTICSDRHSMPAPFSPE